MKKIALMVSNLCTLGGTERVTANLSKDLSQYYDCTIITQWCNGKYAYDIDKKVKLFNLYDKQKRLRYIVFDAVKRIREYILKNKIEVVIVVGRNNGIIPLLVKLCTKVKLVYCEHNSVVSYRFYNESIRQKAYRRLLQTMLYHVPDCVVTLTDKDLAYYKNSSMSCCRIYNAIDENLLNINCKYDVNSKKIITVGRVDYQKGYEYLIEVAKKVFSKHPDWQWDIYGNESLNINYSCQLKNEVKKEGLEDRVIFHGDCSNIYDVYKEHSFLVMTSRYEGFGMVLIEAKANGLPVISFDIEAGPSDIIRNGIDGYLVKAFDVNSMTEKICEFIEHDDKRYSCSQAAAGNLGKFSSKTITKQWIELIERI